ncbi:hypothetical protein C0J52_00740 [Blattella germanica]|nr:hypothetical protein C0J52_00740 [Blattella germanica]
MSSENGETQNETPSESDRMDISEVSDQVSPVSDQCVMGIFGYRAWELGPTDVGAGNAKQINRSHLANTFYISKYILHSLINTLLRITTVNITIHLNLFILNEQETRCIIKQSPVEAVDNQAPKKQSLDNASAADAAPVANATRERLDSALSLEGFDLELPTLDTYQEEYVDFPSSPKQLKECLEAHGLAMPLERDSGTMGRSEEEDDEDTSIYQAVLSPDCQDVRLKKDLQPTALNEDFNGNKDPGSVKSKLRRLLTPNPEDTLLPDLYGNRAIPVICDITKAASSQDLKVLESQSNSVAKTKSKSSLDLRTNGEDSNFIFERRDSKRYSKKYGGRVVEGLFVESPLLKDKSSAKKLGLRKISLSHSLLTAESPTSDDSPATNRQRSFEERLNLADLDASSPSSKNRVTTAAEVHRQDSEECREHEREHDGPKSLASAPRPKSRRKTKNVESVDPRDSNERGPVLLLDPAALQCDIPCRGAPNVNPDGSVEIRQERPGSLVAPQRGGRRRIRVTADILTGTGGDTIADGDESSAESRLSDTDMMSPDDDPDLDALLSPDLDTPDEMEDSIMERLGEPPPEPVAIPELSAAEERAEARSWRSVVVAGLERRIDMKVIEPYKRVLSHGGYLSAGSHNAIIVFSACFLPDRSRVDYDYVMDNLFLYVLTTLDQLITEDYVLIYLHGATSRSCMPTFSWLKRCYQMIDRRLRKNLKGLYLVHPTFWLKTIVIMTRPFISSKFSRKLSFVESLAELADIVPLEQASIPDRVKQYDQIRQSLEHGN